MEQIELGSKLYEKVETFNLRQLSISGGILSEIPLKPIFFTLSVAIEGDNDVLGTVLKGDNLESSIKSLLVKNEQDNLIAKLASLTLKPKGEKLPKGEDYEAFRKEIEEELLEADYHISLDLVGFFLEKNMKLSGIMKNFFQVEEAEMPK